MKQSVADKLVAGRLQLCLKNREQSIAAGLFRLHEIRGHVDAPERGTTSEDEILLMLLKELGTKWGRRRVFPRVGARARSRIGGF